MNRSKLQKFFLLGVTALMAVTALWILFSRPTPSSRRVATASTAAAQGVKPDAMAALAGAPQPVAAPSTWRSTQTNGIFRTPDLLWSQRPTEESFARFHDWVERYRQATPAERAAMETEGVALAQTRREAMKTLIQSDPERALELAVPYGIRSALPVAVTELLETPLSARGRLAVLGALPEPGRENDVAATFRRAAFGDEEFEAFVYGRRLGEPTRNNIPLHGVALDQFFAVSENPLRILGPEETAEALARLPAGETLCAVSGQSSLVNNEQVVADLGGEVVLFCRPEHAEELNAKSIAADGGGPTGGDPGVEPSAWTEGQKKLIVIRVDFPNLTGAPLADATCISLIQNLHNFYSEMSYGRAGFYTNGAGSDFTPTFRMPQPGEYYGTNNYYDQLRADARAAATAAGYVLGNYNLDVICLGPVGGWGWSGLGYVGAAGAWLRNSFSTGVAGHELGHNYGLNHANFWDTSGLSVIGAGTSVEYGDSFDTMGSASAGNNHFNARYKNYLNWLTTNEVVTATSNGVYRVYAHDNPASPGIRGLRIVKNSGTNYWVEFRQKFTSNKWLMNGGGLRWAQSGNQKSHLLDITPGSTDTKNDSAIVIGRTFSDKISNIHITPIGKGGTSPESLDVRVNIGSFPGNSAPTVNLTASATNAATGVTLGFSAAAADADGDTLAYYWEFGDGNFSTSNTPAVNKSWSATGDYVVRCVVSDMKGGVASKWVIVTIGSPTTFRLSGQVTTTSGPVQDVRVYVSTTRMAYTDSDGNYAIVGLPAAGYTVNASLENYVISPSGFVNPVSVLSNITDINFDASTTAATAPAITTQPLSQSVNPGANVTFTVVASGSAPLAYQWRFNSANISGATGSSYTRSNVQATNAGNYSVVVTNSAGNITSANAVLALNTPPVITSQPASQSVIAGANVAFTVAATGSAPLAYQWRFNGTNLAGATASGLSLPNAQPVNAGNYSVALSNSVGSVTSSVATLTVNLTLTVSATTGGSVTKNPNLASYATGSLVTLTATPSGSYVFAGWTGDAGGTNNPLSVTLTTNQNITADFEPPVSDLIVDNPQATFTGSWSTATSASDKYGADYRTASVVNSGTPTATATFRPTVPVAGRYDVYAWFPTVSKGYNSAPFLIAGSEGNLNVSVNQTTGSGGWRLIASGRMFAAGTNGFVRLSNNGGPGNKNVAADAVRWSYSANQASSPPTITLSPADLTVVAGDSATFSVEADSPSPLGYQWRYFAADIVGATNSAFVIPTAQPLDAGEYSVVLTNEGGSVTSAVANLTVLLPPAIGTQPQSLSAIAGGQATFAVSATGTAPLTYQWRIDNAPLAGETNATLLLNNVQPGSAGDYSVEVTNDAGSVLSDTATLTVLEPPQILSAPQALRVREGSNGVFAVSAGGTVPLHYQWRFNSTPIPGATDSSLALASVTPLQAGDYDVTVTNVAGTLTSPAAALTVSVRPTLSSIVLGSNGLPQLTMTGTAGDRYTVESSTNLLNWSPMATLTNVTGILHWSDPAGSGGLNRFYRALLPD